MKKKVLIFDTSVLCVEGLKAYEPSTPKVKPRRRR
jgi:hypothetical protein